MQRSWFAAAVLAAALVSWPATTAAQTTGGIAGKVTDSTGGVLPGATVTLTGPAMQGTQTATTDSLGEFRFRNIPPGQGYKLTVTLNNFREATRENLQVYLGQEGTMTVSLVPAGRTEEVRVVAGSPLVDVTQTTIGVNITASQFHSLPVARSFQMLTTIAPSVSLEMGDHDRRLNASPTVGAASAPENNYIIDGLSSTDPRYGTSGTNLTMNFVQEVQVMTGGYQAEFGRSTGGVFNVITRSGGNQFHGDLFSYFQNKSWTPESTIRRQNKELITFADRDSYSDVGGSIGGPISRDKLWFFGAYAPQRRTVFVGGTSDDVGTVDRQYDRRSDIYAGKLTWTPKSGNMLVFTAFGDPTEREGWLTNPNAVETSALRLEETGSHNFSARYNSTLTPRWLLEASVGRHSQRSDLGPATTAGATIPRQIDETVGGYEHGGFMRVQKDKAIRDAFAVKLTNITGNHEFRYGFDVERNHYDADLNEVWYRWFGEHPSWASWFQERNYFVQGAGTTLSSALFAQDSWRIASNLRLNAGIRYETQRLDSAEDVAIAGEADAEACTAHGECRTVDGLTLKGHWAPRVGLVWDPLKNGRTKIYGFWGRFHENVPLNINIRAINGERYIITDYGNPVSLSATQAINPTGSPLARNGNWTNFRVRNLTLITPLDEDLQTQFQDEFVLGADYQFGSFWSAGARYVHRSLRRIIEDIGTFVDPGDPYALTGYVIGNPGEGFFGAPFEKPERTYNGLEFSLTRRLNNGWQLYSSVVYSRARGNHEGLYMSGYDQLDPNINALYDIPSFIPNAAGRMRSDKPFQFKMHGSYTFDWGLTVSEGLVVSSGVPISAQGPEIVNGYGDGTIFLLPRGSAGRTETYWNLDLHADYRLPFLSRSGPRQLSVIVDVFNVFNRHGVLEVDQDYIYQGMPGFAPWEAAGNLDEFGNPRFNPSLASSQFYKTPSLFQTPRSLQIGIRFTY
jgi:outer membrane receptor protein involved in Fe transport